MGHAGFAHREATTFLAALQTWLEVFAGAADGHPLGGHGFDSFEKVLHCFPIH